MRRLMILLSVLLSVGAYLFFTAWHSEASPPPPQQEDTPQPIPAAERPPAIQAPLQAARKIDWHLDRNMVVGQMVEIKGKDEDKQLVRIVKAIDSSELDFSKRQLVGPDQETPFALWSYKFPQADLPYSNGYASVVDKDTFTDLRIVDGQSASKLGPEGIVIGRVKLEKYDPVELVEFLVTTGIVNANLHVEATVTGTHTTSPQGDWFSLHSIDPYWTNSRNTARYSFGIHIAKDGTMRMINRSHMGQLPTK